MQARKFARITVAGLAVLSALVLWSGCATAPPPTNLKLMDCAGSNIQWEVAPEAEIVNFSCALGTHEGDPSLIYTVKLKNAADKAYRFRLGIFLLDMDKAMGYLVPAKGKPPVLAPGEVATVKIPFMKTTAMSRKTMVRVVPMGGE